MDTDAPADLQKAFEQVIAISPFTRWMGTRIVSARPGLVVIEATLRDEHRQHHGYAHGAVVSYMADTACAWVAASVVGDVVTSEFKINLLAPAVGKTLRARGEVVKAGSRQVVARADVWAVGDDEQETTSRRAWRRSPSPAARPAPAAASR